MSGDNQNSIPEYTPRPQRNELNPRNNFPTATAPDILRSIQKDETHLLTLRKMFVETITNIFGSAFVMRYNSIIQAISDSFYYATTTLIGNQTIGEEYSDIILDHSGQYPSWIRRLFMVALCVGSPFVRLASNANGNQETLDLITKAKQLIAGPFLSLHLALFYFFGSYYELSKRIAGVKYKLVRKLRNGETHGGYEVLGLLIVIRIALTSLTRKKAAVDYE
ncbi:peroxisome biogenesis factor 10 [Boothiomyces sp. JEL0838]|nr:peroxisome biogenesis factor 10 [Boothiomyces sp. JEL0838]